MKAMIEKDERQFEPFEPFTLRIEVETREEACRLWHRLHREIIPADCYAVPFADANVSAGWVALNDELIRQKIRE